MIHVFIAPATTMFLEERTGGESTEAVTVEKLLRMEGGGEQIVEVGRGRHRQCQRLSHFSMWKNIYMQH